MLKNQSEYKIPLPPAYRGVRREIKYTVNETGCFICTSHKSQVQGYTQIRVSNKCLLMHRHVYMLVNSVSLTPKQELMHKCDNPSCINPDHLTVGTHKENMVDMKLKGRGNSTRGIQKKDCKLTEEQVLEIRKNTINTRAELARMFKVSWISIDYIKKRIKWKHVA